MNEMIGLVVHAQINPDDGMLYITTKGDGEKLSECMEIEKMLEFLVGAFGYTIDLSNDCEGCYNECRLAPIMDLSKRNQ